MAEPARTPPVGEQRRPGMDHAHHAFRTLTEAPRFDWPDGARIAFTVTLVLDCWELNSPKDADPDPRIVSPLGKFFPDWLTWSQREYGARVGIFRVLDVLDRFGVTRRNACFLAHGTYATRRISSRMTEAEERAFIIESRDAVRAAAGEAPLGWCGQDFNQSDHTLALLAEAGFAYTTDWASDDRPFLLDRGLIALPPQPEWNDLECMWLRRVPPLVWADTIAEAFAFLPGQAHRIRWLREALSRVLGHRQIWRTTTDEVARMARKQS